MEDVDNVLNTHEATVRCITHEYDNELFDLTYGKKYKAIGRDRDGLYLVMDDSHDCYFYLPTCFEIVSDEYDILSHRSVYFSSTTGKNELIFAYRRINKMMKTEKFRLETYRQWCMGVGRKGIYICTRAKRTQRRSGGVCRKCCACGVSGAEYRFAGTRRTEARRGKNLCRG